MPTKIRLQRHGKKHFAYFHIVIADGRAPRDGKFIEKIGTYNPNVNPAQIDLNFDKAFEWLKNGAQPTDTAKAILSYKGVLYKYHLYRGVLKNALTQEAADKKFDAWLKEKQQKVEKKTEGLSKVADEKRKTQLAQETEMKEKRAKEIAAKNVPPKEEAPIEAAAEAEIKTETPEVPAVETTPEAKVEEKTAEEAKTEVEVKEEKPAEEPKAEETPAEEVKAEAKEEPKSEA